MDWTTDRIDQHHPLAPIELRALQLRKKSTRYTCFARIAYWDYRTSNYNRKMYLIELITGQDDFPDDVHVRDIVSQCWSGMSEDVKLAWERRSMFYSTIPLVGEFRTLPSVLFGRLNFMVRGLIRTECDLILVKLNECFMQRNQDAKEKKMVLKMPQKIVVGHKVTKLFTMSTFVRYIIFGENLSKVPENENHSINKKSMPGFVHLASLQSVQRLLTIEDVSLMTFINHERNTNHTITSLGTMENISGGLIKCYGWSETANSITFIFNARRENDPAQHITFPRPKLQKYERFRANSTRKIVEYKFELSDEFNAEGYRLTSFTPVCLRVHYKSFGSFRFMGARLAYRKENRSTFLVSGFSS